MAYESVTPVKVTCARQLALGLRSPGQSVDTEKLPVSLPIIAIPVNAIDVRPILDKVTERVWMLPGKRSSVSERAISLCSIRMAAPSR